ncbi:hypothetical protein SK803_42160 [Lentzea sp. BCCO 10_0856]|uniref:Membrane-associated oxidoreductase n=1 Tax=Lentzea miocenica TaxID=3095431 RepID=A0ABU4TF86_9PSEU|nr:hypothetical protein [Lentzea sp. BCCO 10_0856]MDX8036841.1 hypothetical protein [Lentzea sp. BCCO 10_0856]
MKRAAEAGEILDLSRRGNNVLRADAIRDVLRAGDHDPRGLQVIGARITGALDLGFVQSATPLLLDGCLFEEPLSLFHTELPGLSLDDSTIPGISAEGLKTAYFAMRDARCTGLLDLDNARIDGPLLLTGSSLRGLSAGSMHVSRDVWMDGVFITSEGIGCWFDSCEIGMDLLLNEAVVDAANDAIYLDGARIGGVVRLHNAFVRAGGKGDALTFIDATARELRLSGTVLRSDAGMALCGNGAHIRSDITLDRDFNALNNSVNAAVQLVNTRLGGDLWIGGSVRNRRGRAVAVHRAAVEGSLVIANSRIEATSFGAALEISDTDAGGEVTIIPDSIVNHANGLAVDLFTTRAGRALRLHVTERIAAGPFTASLNGLTYPEPPEDTDAWLTMLRDHTREYEAQPYQQLAAVHRAAGHEHTARKVLIAQQRDLRRRGDPGNKLWHWFLGVTLGYGYKPSRAVVGLLVTFVLAICLVWTTNAYNGLTPAKDRPADSCSPVNRISLAADLAIPLVKLGGTPRCELANGPAGQWATGAGWVVQILGWSFATLSVAGFTGLVRKS